MNDDSDRRHSAKIEELAVEYEAKGYKVSKEPSAAELPFSLGNYVPDLVAQKDGGGYIFEVKTSASQLSLDRFQNISREVSAHPNWRFLLVTLDPQEDAIIKNPEHFPSWETLAKNIAKTSVLLDTQVYEAALLYLWSCFEVGLRKKAFEINLPADQLPPSQLLKSIYTSGEISVDEIDLATEFMLKRNQAAHGVSAHLDEATVTRYLSFVTNLLEEWHATQT